MTRFRAFMRVGVSIDSSVSTCTALEAMHVTRRAQTFFVVEFRLVFGPEATCHGPMTSIPTAEKGGPGSVLSLGRSAMMGFSILALSRRQTPQELTSFVT